VGETRREEKSEKARILVQGTPAVGLGRREGVLPEEKEVKKHRLEENVTWNAEERDDPAYFLPGLERFNRSGKEENDKGVGETRRKKEELCIEGREIRPRRKASEIFKGTTGSLKGS